jgi:hypothetical protein
VTREDAFECKGIGRLIKKIKQADFNPLPEDTQPDL